ncbi:PGPGW domain-containing protein [Aestuariivirga sp.]|uniref:PGPGW domain-containing protein n=1 Tax=Aestuariivirga sp. TaxID=2650926 RepID=UPI0039E434EF
MKIAGRTIPLPGHPVARATLGIALVSGGLLGFLPILGFWMIPVGLAVLAVDFPMARRAHRRLTVKMGAFLHRKAPRHAHLFGFGAPRPGKH